MANFIPLSEVNLIQLEIDIDNKNQLTFQDLQAQENFFSTYHDKLRYQNLTYIRKDGYIVVPDHVDNIYKYNYLFYKNADSSNKWYYAFIIKCEWLSDNSTKVYIKTDVYQTYQFNFIWKRSFVEREMIDVGQDVRGANLELEDLETGEYIVDGSVSVSGLGIVYCFACSTDPHDIPNQNIGVQTIHGTVMNALASGLWYYIGNYSNLLAKIQELATLGFAESIKAVFSIPSCAVLGFDSQTTIQDLDNPDDHWGTWLTGNLDLTGYEFSIDPNITTLAGYQPRNKKLLQYPFTYLGFNPPSGNPKIFRYEDMGLENGMAKFKMISEINPNPNVMLLPKLYKNDAGYNMMEACVISGYPNISYSTDFFNNWIAQNGDLVKIDWNRQDLNYDMNMAKSVAGYMANTLGAVGSIAGGNLGALGNFAEASGNVLLDTYGQSRNHDLDIQQRQAQIEKQQMLPNNASIGSSATIFEYNLFNWSVFKRYCIKPFFAQRIDEYFDMFGYKTNKLKTPLTHNRPNWNYVKTINAIIVAKDSTSQVNNTIPQDDLQELKTLFNNGITLWHNPATFLDYAQNNR